jgi:uncharacterized protein YdhG (YjbR/CyaY superfamily)
MKQPAKGQRSPVDAYLAKLPDGHRRALERIRTIIRKAYPAVEETTYYGLPAFRLDGVAFVAFRSTKQHCALLPLSGTVVEALADRLTAFETTKGTIRFTPEKPLPEPLVRAVLKCRAEQMS